MRSAFIHGPVDKSVGKTEGNPRKAPKFHPYLTVAQIFIEFNSLILRHFQRTLLTKRK